MPIIAQAALLQAQIQVSFSGQAPLDHMFAHRQQKPARRGFLSPGGPVLCHSTCLSAPSLPRLEGGHGALLGLSLLWFDFRLGDTLADFHRRPLSHLVGDMGVGVQCGGTGHMAQDVREGLNVHPVGQGVGGEGVPQILLLTIITRTFACMQIQIKPELRALRI